MRVVAGKLKGRKIKAVPSIGTRPVLERVRTALFDTLNPDLPDAQVLDAFAGTGSLGIEAISRGARHCTFLDLGNAAVQTLRHNVKELGIEQQSEIRKTDAFAFVRHSQKTFDIIFIAPPQYKGLWSEMLTSIGERPDLVAADGLVVVQIDPKELEGSIPNLNHFELTKQKKYGNTLVLLFRKTAQEQKDKIGEFP